MLLLLHTTSVAIFCTRPSRQPRRLGSQRAQAPLLTVANELYEAGQLRSTLLSEAESIHARECAYGIEVFNTDHPQYQHAERRHFEDADLVTHRIGAERLAGPDARLLRGPSLVHQTRRPVLSMDEIDALKDEASVAMAEGLHSNYRQFVGSHNLLEARVAQLPAAREWLTARLADTFFPLLSGRYGVEQSALRVSDALIINYAALEGAARQQTHRDGALLSLNIALSEPGVDFEGGGTFFEGLLDRSDSLPQSRRDLAGPVALTPL